MKIMLNGEERELDGGATVTDAVALVGASGADRGVAVAVNGQVLPKGEWPERVLHDGESVEVVHAVQGG